MSSYFVHRDVYSIQQYVIKFDSNLQQVYPGYPAFSTDKTDRHDMIEILLKATSNIITLTLTPFGIFKLSWINFPFQWDTSE